MRPLDGITVLSFEQAVAAPFCTRQLADFGARVIKVERPDAGDFARHYDDRVRGLSSYFVWCNRSKESLTLDIKAAAAGEVIERLLACTDVLVQNLAPGATARLGLDYDSLKDRFPGLIVCDISGYGADGPYRDKKAYDLLIQSESGFVSVTGTEESPAKAPAPIADVAAATCATNNILAALLQRAKTGHGCRLDVSMLEAMLEINSYPLYYSFGGADPPPRRGADHATIYPYGIFKTGGGRHVILGLQNEREWKKFCEQVLDQPDLTTDPRFSANALRSTSRDELREIIETVFAELSVTDVIDKLDKAGIANARMNDMHEVWQHGQLDARKRWINVDSPVGPVPALLPPGLPNEFEPQMGAVPELGQHTDAILSEFSYTKEQIAELRATGAV
ncbi:MAG: CoA transferase [Gammaproteobacteria bacterium]|nr:CoA transferase [Gammaproteobacteria bacterium]